MIPVHFDLETADPDDIMTLALLATHPNAQLRSVTITPGGQDQVDLVNFILTKLNRPDIEVGAGLPKEGKLYVSAFYYKWLGKLPYSKPAPSAESVLNKAMCHPGTVVVTGAKLTNIANALGYSHAPILRWVGQGGFAGDEVVPEEYRLDKFKGKNTCPTFNFNGDLKAATTVLTSTRVLNKTLVSKNVCHGVVWDQAFHDRVLAVEEKTLGLELCIDLMTHYLNKTPDGKKLHDPLAAMIALNPAIGEFRNVTVYREKGGYGSRLNPESDTEIIISYNPELFFEELTRS